MGEHKSKKRTTSFRITDRERQTLCELFLASTVKGQHEQRQFNRAFDALGLDAFEATFKPGVVERTDPGDGAFIADVADEDVEYTIGLLDKIELRGAGARRIASLLVGLESVKASTYKLDEEPAVDALSETNGTQKEATS